MDYLEEYYNSYDEEGRLLSRHGQVEFLTTMKYIEEYLKDISDPSIILQIRRECPCFQTWDESPNQREMMLVFLSTKSNLGLDSVSAK